MQHVRLDLNSKYMQDETIKTQDSAAATPVAAAATEKKSFSRAPRQSGSRAPFKSGDRRPRAPRAPREKPEFDSKAISIRRVTRVVSGGRRFSLAASVVIGDRNGRVGLGTGKALDNAAAMDKAIKDAKKNMITVKLSKNKSITHEVDAKFDTARVWMAPNKGKGLIAGSSARVIFALAGITDTTAKFHGGTKNKLNNARATMKALEQLAIK